MKKATKNKSKKITKKDIARYRTMIEQIVKDGEGMVLIIANDPKDKDCMQMLAHVCNMSRGLLVTKVIEALEIDPTDVLMAKTLNSRN